MLASTPVFRRLPRRELIRLSRGAGLRWFRAGSVLAPEVLGGDEPTDEEPSLFVIATGWSTAVRSLPDGNRAIVAIRGAGQVAGIERLARTSATPRARWPTATIARGLSSSAELPAWTAAGWVHVVSVARDALVSAMDQSPAAHDEVDALARERIAELETMLAERNLESTERLFRTLRRLALAYGRATAMGYALHLPLTQTELAVLVGTTRETVNRSLGCLAARGAVTLWQGRPRLVRTDIAERHWNRWTQRSP